MDEKKKELTELQSKFLAVLFGEANGNFPEAKRLAGYSEFTTVAEVVEPLKDEIIRHSVNFLAAHGPKAIFTLVNSLDERQPNANKLKAVQMILDRVGITEKKTDGLDLANIPKGGIFILPAKDVQVFKRVEDEVFTKVTVDEDAENQEDETV